MTSPAPPVSSSAKSAGRSTTAGSSTSARRAPERRRGQLAISFDDVDQAVEEVYWAKEHGLGGIRLPGLTRSGRFFFDPDLDPIWAACEETGLTVSQHGGAADPNEPSGGGGVRATAPGFGAFMMISTENAFFSNRSLWMLIAGGVFDRFPDLRAAWIETQVHLIIPTINYLDKVCDSDWMGQWSIKPAIKRLPSEYVGTNVFFGVSPFSPRQDPSGDVLGMDVGRQLQARVPHGRPLAHVRRRLPALRDELQTQHG